MDIKELIENPKIYYIYRMDNEIYGLKDDPRYLVLTDNPSINTGDLPCLIITMDAWWQMVDNCDLLCWKMACLKPKFIIKETVKILMTTDIVKLYDNIAFSFPKDDSDLDRLWSYVNDVALTNQIAEFHKIKNYNIVTKLYDKIKDYDDFLDAVAQHYTQLKSWGEGPSTYAKIKRLEKQLEKHNK